MAKWQGVDPIEWCSKIKDAPRDAVNIFALSILNEVVDKTPVDTGTARQNWLVTVNQETTESNPERTNGNVINEGAAVIRNAKGDDTIYIQNNLPYIGVLEFGRVNGVKNPVKTTPQGRSTQSPNGMVGVTLAKADQLWDKAVKENL